MRAAGDASEEGDASPTESKPPRVEASGADAATNAGSFRAKTGGIGDVLETNDDPDAGTSYAAAVESPVSNDVAIEGQVVENASASSAAALTSSSDDAAMDALYDEIAAKNNIDLDMSDAPPPPVVGGAWEDAPFVEDPPSPPPPPARDGNSPQGNSQPAGDPTTPGAGPTVTPLDIPGYGAPGAVPSNAPSNAAPGVEPQVMPPGSGPVGPVPPTVESAVAVTQVTNPMDRLYEDLMLESSSLLDDGDLVETVQVISVRFRVKKQVNFGEILRMVGGHESMGAWSLRRSPALKWTKGDIWESEDLELPVDGVFVYKYVVTDAADASKPMAWQKGNNQVLTLRAEDAPLLMVNDSWDGDPSKAYTSRADGSDKMQAEVRLVQRIGDADAALHETRMEVMDLRVEVKTAQLQSAALREEARLSSNVRLKLKQQLAAEKKRSEVLEEQVTEWKNKYKALGPGKQEKRD